MSILKIIPSWLGVLLNFRLNEKKKELLEYNWPQVLSCTFAFKLALNFKHR